MRGTRLGFIATALLSGCDASDRQAPDPSSLELSKPEGSSGDFQVEVAGRRLSVSPTEVRTGADGLAATTWTTMALYAEQFATASIEGGPWIGFNAIATPDPDAPNSVLVRSEGGGRFEPAEFAMPAGGTVNWVWTPGSMGHNIVADDGESPPPSGAPADWPKWHVFTFPRPGVYRYHCSVHGGPGGVGMSGTITVTEPGEQ